MKDRTYYRLEDNYALLEEARYNPNAELCVVLALRLRAALDKLDDMETSNDR